MRWFKHLTISQEDEILSELLDNFGAEGYGVWWLIIQHIALHMNHTDRCSCRYSVRKWRQITRLSTKKLKKTLSFLSKSKILLIKNEENYITIANPNLLKYRDEYTSRKKKTPDNVPTPIGRDSDIDTEYIDTDTKKEKEINKEKEKASTSGGLSRRQIYQGALTRVIACKHAMY